ncbi:glutamate-rich protein 6-like isoform X2 [Engraulis encrasicolus]|uniref:glutamate-rich protein 6-like isoform X2 n=1 Tax=Engraulis encrasicolus TaxID=184585 RepID=UPI002FD65833
MSEPSADPGGSELSATLPSTQERRQSSPDTEMSNEEISKTEPSSETSAEMENTLTRTVSLDQNTIGLFDSPEIMEVQTVDGRVITVASAVTQTDWDWEQSERQQKDDSSAHIVIEELSETPPVEDIIPSVRESATPSPDTKGNVEDEKNQSNKQENKAYGIPYVGPPSLLAYRPESKQPPVRYKSPVDRQPGMRKEKESILCVYCQQPATSFVSRENLENLEHMEATPEQLFCCDKAQSVRMLILQEERALAGVEVDKKIDVGPHPPFMSKQQKRAAKERAEQRLREFEAQRAQTTGHQNRLLPCGQQIKTISYRLSNGDWTIHEEPDFHRVDTLPVDYFSVRGEAPVTHTRKEVLLRLYPDGGPFLTIFPDGTGNVFYPSGCIAVTISTVGAGDFTYTVLEDNPCQPSIQAIFTSKGHSTCYHPNGLIWVNLNQLEGLHCSENGALKQHWSWHDLEPDIHPLPFQPLYLSLNPFISLRILTQERIYLTFSHGTCRVRFNVGAKLKLMYPEGVDLPVPDTLQKHLQIKCLEIYSLLDRIQTHIDYQHMPSHQNIKPLYGLIAQMDRLRRQVDRHSSPKKLQTPIPPKEA